MAPAMTAPPARGGSGGLIALAVFGGLVVVGALIATAMFLKGGSDASVVPPPSATPAVVVAPPASGAPSSSASTHATPVSPAPAPHHPSASSSPASPAPSSSAGMIPGMRLSWCNALHSTYCGDQYKQVDPGKCLTFGQSVTNRWYTPEAAAQKDSECKAENESVMLSLAARKH
jgi:hypothetical protein